MTADQAADDEQTGIQTEFIGQGERAYEGLLDLVLSKEIAPGEAVTERRLALRLGLSRTPIREALHRLEGEGLLERRDGKHHVRGLTVEDVMEALHVRSLLETDAARRAAGRIPHRALSELRGRLVILQQGADPGVPDHRATDEDLHGLIASHSGNQLLAEMITGLRQRTRMFSMKRMPERFGPICAEHIAIVDALAAGDGARAAAEVASHLAKVKQSILMKLAEG